MNRFILILLTQIGFDSQIAYGAAPAGAWRDGAAQTIKQQGSPDLETRTKSVMVRPRAAAADFVQQAGGLVGRQEFSPIPGPQPVSYAVSQATFNDATSSRGASASKSQPAAGTKADATKAKGASPPRNLPDATGTTTAIGGRRSTQPPAAMESEEAERRGATSSVIAPGRIGGGASETETTGDADRASRAAASASTALLETSLTPAKDSALAGSAVTLSEAVGRGASLNQRFEIAELYWRLALATANFNWAADESRQLEALPAGQGAIDAPLLTTARAATAARMLEAQALAVAAQQELADALGQTTQSLPLTVEQPLVGPYRTLFDRLYATRSPPPRTRAIDRALPLKRQAIDARTAAVQAAVSAVHAAEESHAQGKADVLTVLASHQELARQRRDFLRVVGDYNADIVAYAAAVANPGTSNTVLVSMLTRSKATRLTDADSQGSTLIGRNQPTLADPVFDPDQDVQPAAATEDARESESGWLGADRPRIEAGGNSDGRAADSLDANVGNGGAGELRPIERESSARE